MATRRDRAAHRGWRSFDGGRRGRREARQGRRLRFEPLEERQLLAVADATGGVLHYTADPGEQNDVVLSPGHFFSIQDAADVAQFGLGGCTPSDFLRGMSVSVSAGTGVIIFGFEIEVGVDFGFPLFIDTRLPDGVICPTPSGLNTGSDSAFADALHNGLANAAKGASPAVAGAPVQQDGAVYYKVGAPSGPLDEYRLFQAVVDPASAQSEIPGNSSFLAATPISTSTLVNGTFADYSGSGEDKDFYSFQANQNDELAVIVDNKFDNGQTSDGKDRLANTKLTIYDSAGNELSSAVGFDRATAIGGVKATATGTYYASIEDGGIGNGSDYRFVVIRSNSNVGANSSKVLTFQNSTQQAISGNGSIVSTLGVNSGDAFTRITSPPTNVEVKLNVTFPNDAALHLSLESPSGKTIDLVQTGQAFGSNFTNTTFSDSGTQYAGDLGTAAPYTGIFKAVGSLATFAGDSTNGNWKLHVQNGAGAVGTLDNWSLAFTLATDEVPATANPMAANQYGVGKAPPALGSTQDVDYYKRTGVSAGYLVFAVADTTDQNNSHPDEEKASLNIFGNDGTTLLPNGTGVDTGPPVSGQSFDSFLDQMRDAGVDLNQLKSHPASVVVDLGDGNDTCDASKVDLLGSSITVHGGPGNDTILLPGGTNVTATGDDGNDTFIVNPSYAAVGTIDGGTGNNNAIQVSGTLGNDNITVKLNGAYLDITVNDVTSLYQVSNIQSLSIDGGGGGDDVVTIDDSGGAISFANGIGITVAGSASKIIFTSGSKTAQSNVIQVGPYPSNGTSTITIDGVTQSVEFNAINPVIGTLISDSVLGPLEVVATDGPNAITLDKGPDAGTSLLSVDHLLAIEFSGKSEMVVDGGAGDDVVNLLAQGSAGLTGTRPPLTVNGDAGNDRITAEPGLEQSVAITLDGGAGNDTLSADATLIGGPGDDILIGGAGNNTYGGGPGFDTILIRGTLSNDVISLYQSDASTLKHSITTQGVTTSGTDSFSGIEMVQVDAGAGDDTVQIKVADGLVATPASSLPFTVNGDAPNASDRLAVQDDGPGDCTIWRQGADGRSGSITVGPLAPVAYTGIEHVDVLPVNAVTDGYGSDGNGRLVIFPTDPMEGNNSRRVATGFDILVGSHVNPTIDPPANAQPGVPQDEDWYQFVAPKTGTFRFQLAYQTIGTLPNGRPGLPGDGKLVVSVYDGAGNLIAKAAGEGDASHTIGVQKGVTYYVRVRGATSDAVNVYDVNLIDVDTFGPQVTNVAITGANSYNLFTQKSLNAGNVPTPLVYSLTIGIQDLVARYPGYLYPALDQTVDLNPGHYRLVGDANGVIPIATVSVINDAVSVGSVPTGRIVLGFSQALPDDRYTLTIFSGVLDPAGNALDGETNTIEPHVSPALPSGDGVAGGDFVARFTVDSRPEIGVWTAGSVYVDTNGNFQYDPTNSDATNRDYAYSLGYTSDAIFAGNFAQTAASTADGFSKLAAYGKVGNTFRWLIDLNNDGVPDIYQTDPANIVGSPVAGNFDGNAANGDEVGLFDGKTWYLDGNHDFMVRSSPADLRITNGMSGMPIVGDFDGDGKVDLATYNAGKFYFDFASNGYGKIDATIDVGYLSFPGARMRPVAADMDGDGITDIGLWCPDRAGVSPDKVGEWYFLVSNDPGGTLRKTGTVVRLNHAFSLLPPSKDIFARMGSEFAVPVVGNFDPPVVDAHGTPVVSAGLVTVSLVGTPQNDQFTVAPGSGAGTWTITLNGKSQTLLAGSLDLSIDGGGGRDTVSLTTTAADDQIECWPNRATVVGAGYKMSVRGMLSITIDARTGSNSATLHGSSGSDALTATAGTASLSGSGYSMRVLGARRMVVDGGTGGNDSAALTGTAGNDAFFASPTSASLSGADYAIGLRGFRTVSVQAGSGGRDTATLVGSAGADQLTASSRTSTLSGSGFRFDATGFTVVNVDGGGGKDTATITDGLVQGPLNSGLVGTLPAPYRSALWLSRFSQIKQTKKSPGQTPPTAAVDLVFAAFWK